MTSRSLLRRLPLAAALWLVLAGCAGPRAAAPGAPPPPAPCTVEGDAAMRRGDLPAALIRHRELLARDPANGLAWYHLGFILGEGGDLAAEIESYERAIAAGLDDNAQLYANLGMARGEAGEADRARAAFQRALALAPCNADAWFGMGTLATGAQPSPTAEEAFRRALECDPGHRPARDALIRIYAGRGEIARARELAREMPLAPAGGD